MNKIFVTGNLTNVPVINSTKTGKAVTKFGIAVNRPFSKDNEVDFFNVTAWGATAEFVCNYFDKGRRALIEGRLQTSNYTDKDGNKRTGFDIIADNIEFADSKKKAANDDGKPDDFVDMPF